MCLEIVYIYSLYKENVLRCFSGMFLHFVDIILPWDLVYFTQDHHNFARS